MKWTEVIINIEPETEELVCSLLNDLGIMSLSIEDPNYLEILEQNPEDWDYIDVDSVKIKDNQMKVKIYFDENEDYNNKIEEIKALFKENEYIDEELHKVSINKVEEKDWSENWKKYYKTTRIGNNIIIKPSWEEYDGNEDEIIIEIDPGMAFGTGTHETTSMCTEALEKYLNLDWNVYDIGTGSGILSLVSGKLGAKSVIGVDFDEKAVKVAKENVKNNRLEEIVEIKEGNLLDLLEDKAELVVANIMADIIIGMVKDVKTILYDGGIFISSGIITEKIEDVKYALIENNFEILEVNIKKDWACIIAKLR